MAAEQAKAVKEVQRASAAYERQKTLIVETKHELEGQGVAVGRLANEEARLKREIDGTTAAFQREAAAAERATVRRRALAAAGRGASGIVGIVGIGAGYEGERAAAEVVQTYREFDKQRRWAKAVMNLSDDQQQGLVQQAIHGSASSKFNDIKWLETQRELASRGLNVGQVMGMTPTAAVVAQALGTEMPDAAKMIEASLFGFKRDTSTAAAAEAAAKRTADLQVRAAKASGMTPEDLTELYKYGATPARLAGVSEEMLLAFGAVEKRSNIGGDEAGVAWRALIKNLISPTAEARTAMLAHGLNFKNYQRNPSHLDVAPFVQDVAAKYGVTLSAKAQAGLKALFANQQVIGDPSKFTPAVMRFLQGELRGRDAKSLKSIAGEANRYRDASMQGVDVNKLLADLMPKLGNLQLANTLFGSRMGGRIAAGAGDPATLKMILGLLNNDADGYALKMLPRSGWPASTALSACSKIRSRTWPPTSAGPSTRTAGVAFSPRRQSSRPPWHSMAPR